MKFFREWSASFTSRSNVFARRHAMTLISLFLLVILIFAFFFNRMVISIKPGDLGVLYRWLGEGTVIDTVYREGAARDPAVQ